MGLQNEMQTSEPNTDMGMQNEMQTSKPDADEWFYWASFFVCLLIVVVLHFRSKNKKSTVEKSPEFRKFQRNYLFVYLCGMFADWLKGPYVYALYESYGFTPHEIAKLFIGGFLSSLIVGTVVGSLSDKFGRKKMCILFAILYMIAGITKTFNNYSILMFGRVLSGIATSLLFSVFEAWMVCEHHKREFHPDLLSDTFGKATFGNGLVAVVAGLVASFVADKYSFVAPFLLALIPLFFVGLVVSTTWTENYGDTQGSIVTSFGNAFRLIRSNKRVARLGCAQSCFEGAMYTFVFMWSPALATDSIKDIFPYGLVFAVFMIAMTIGSSVFGALMEAGYDVEQFPFGVHLLSAAAMCVPGLFPDSRRFVYIGFLVFEAACGVFFPTYGTIRSKHIPEECRASVLNLFRIPVNAFVVLVLMADEYMNVSFQMVFVICAGMHLVSFVLYGDFVVRRIPDEDGTGSVSGNSVKLSVELEGFGEVNEGDQNASLRQPLTGGI